VAPCAPPAGQGEGSRCRPQPPAPLGKQPGCPSRAARRAVAGPQAEPSPAPRPACARARPACASSGGAAGRPALGGCGTCWEGAAPAGPPRRLHRARADEVCGVRHFGRRSRRRRQTRSSTSVPLERARRRAPYPLREAPDHGPRLCPRPRRGARSCGRESRQQGPRPDRSRGGEGPGGRRARLSGGRRARRAPPRRRRAAPAGPAGPSSTRAPRARRPAAAARRGRRSPGAPRRAGRARRRGRGRGRGRR
jgi:hypothetical protein